MACLAADLARALLSGGRRAPGRGRERAFSAAVLALLALLVAGFGAWRLESMPPRDPLGGGTPAGVRTGEGGALTVALIQGNVPQDIKWAPSFQESTSA